MADQTRTLNIKVKFDGGQSVQTLDSIEDALNAVEKDLRNLNKEGALQGARDNMFNLKKITSENVLSVQDMTKAMENYKNIAAVAGRTSPIGKKALAEAGALKDEIDGLQKDIDQLAQDGQNLQAALQLGQGVVAGYTAFQGAVALAGVESEKLMEVMVKLQAAQSVLSGVEQLRATLEKESVLVTKARAFWENATATAVRLKTKVMVKDNKATKAGTIITKAFNAVMAMNPVILVVAAVAALTAGLIALSKTTKVATREQMMANKVTEARIELEKQAAAGIAEETLNLNNLIDTVTRETATREDKNAAIKELQEAYPEYLGNISEEGILTGELSEAIERQTQLIEARAKAEAAAALEKEAFTKQVEAEIAAAQELDATWTDWFAASVTDFVDAEDARRLRQAGAIQGAKDEVEAIQTLKGEYTGLAETLEAQAGIGRFIQMGPDENAIKQMKDRFDKAREEAKRQREKDAADAKAAKEKELADQIAAQQFLDNLMIEVMAEGEEKRIAQRQASFDSEMETVKGNAETRAAIEKELTEQLERDITAIQEEEAQKRQDKEVETLKKREDIRIELMEEGAEKEIEASQILFQMRLEQLETEGVLTEELRVQLEEKQGETLDAIRKKWRDKEAADDKEALDKKIAIVEEGLKQATMAVDTFGALSDARLADDLQRAGDNEKKQEAAQKAAFEREKKLNIARALIAGAQAIVQTIATYGPPPNPLAIAGIASAVTIAGAQIAAISKAKFDGVAASISTPAAAGPGDGGAGGNEDTTTETEGLLPGAGSGDSAQGAQKVFVSAVDISNVQEQSAKIDTIGTLE